MRRPNRRPNYTKTEDIENYEIPPDYLIYKDDADTIAVNGNTGKEDSRNTDSRTVIQYAITALTPDGGKIYIKSGTYLLSTALTVNTSNLEITGQRGTVLQSTAAVNLMEIGATAGVNNFIISTIEMDGDSTGATGLHIENMIRSVIDKMYIHNFMSWGIDLWYNHTITIQNSNINANGVIETVPYSGGICIGHDGPPDYPCNVIRIRDDVIENNVTGIWIVTGTSITVDCCTIEGNHKHGIVVDRRGVADTLPQNIFINAYFEANNISTSANIYDIYLHGAVKQVEISGCYFTGSDVTYAISGCSPYLKGFLLHGCTFQSTSDNYLRLAEIYYAEVHTNTFKDDTPKSGITITQECNAWFHDNDRLPNITTVDANTDITAIDRVMLVDAVGGARTVTLPFPTRHGEPYTIKKIDASGNAVTVNPNIAETIDGAATQVLAAQYNFITVKPDGTNWHIIARG